MFRPIRKKKNELSTEDTKQILREARRGVLAVNGEDGYPYAIPINFIYDETARADLFPQLPHRIQAGQHQGLR